MRVGHRHIALFLAIMWLSLASSAFANSVNMTYVGHQGVVAQNGSPYIGYPYYFSINGSTSYTPLMCDSFDNNIAPGQGWKATVTPFLQGVGMFGSTASLDYKAAGLIFKSMLAGTLTRTQAQWAVWGLFSTNAQNQAYFVTINGASIDSTYLALAATASSAQFKGLVLYTPVGAKPGVGPQEFIGYNAVPEPGTLTLLGTGLVGLAGAIRRKLARG